VWTVEQTDVDLARQHHDETVFTIGNGYLSTRGTFEEHTPGEWRTTFLHGVFDAVPIAVTEIANMPDWTALTVLVDGQEFAMGRGEVRDYRRTLDLRTGELLRSLRWVSPSGASARMEFRRFASLAQQHLAVVTVRVVPDQDCIVEFRSPIVSSAANLNDGVTLVQHTEHRELLGAPDREVDGVLVRTRDRRYQVALAVRLDPVGQRGPTQRWETPGAVSRVVRFDASANAAVGVDKVVAYVTSRDPVAGEPAGGPAGGPGGGRDVAAAAITLVDQAGSADELAAANAHRWAADWSRCDVEIDGDDEMALAVRFAIFHLLIVGPRHDTQVNIGAKTLSGFGYRGHAFWDTEVFMLPLFTYTLPDVARNLLDYRWHRLPQARAKAAEAGLQGAAFPWESADTGAEVTPTWMPDVNDPGALVRVWTGDIEIHISADVAYAVMTYWKVTGDDDWMAARGADLVLETARFYVSRAEPDADGTYHYRNVIGPDEYHEHIDDNAYTNAMARWTISAGLEVLRWLREHDSARAADLAHRLQLTEEELRRWPQVATGIVVEVQPDGLIPQFHGYLDLEDVDPGHYEPRSRSMQAILGVEGVNRTQILKQPDVLMLTFLREEEFAEQQRRVNYAYYTPRTDHVYGSSLGPAMQAIIAARAGLPDDAMEHFRLAALVDLHDLRGNAKDGIHGASCGGLWQAVVFGFAGVTITSDGSVDVRPALPRGWTRLAFTLTIHGRQQRIEITRAAAAGSKPDAELRTTVRQVGP
jgi:kojibiose phosphorylase